jgi:hypothetical protein
LKHKPKRPQNAYFKFRAKRLAFYKDDEDKMEKVTNDWKNIDEKEKEKLED